MEFEKHSGGNFWIQTNIQPFFDAALSRSVMDVFVPAWLLSTSALMKSWGFGAGLPRPSDPTFDPNQSRWRAQYGSVGQHQTSETFIAQWVYEARFTVNGHAPQKKNSCRFWGKVCSYLYLFICDLWFLFQMIMNSAIPGTSNIIHIIDGIIVLLPKLHCVPINSRLTKGCWNR